jgi:D-sedoheptulose 7-phosphate isomerase
MIKSRIKASIDVKEKLLTDVLLVGEIENAANTIIDCYKNGNKLWLCGNGGSASDAQHIAAELTGRYYIDRPALFAEALHVNSSYITAVSNDYSFDEIYARYLSAAAKKGDVLIAISTSGNSNNIIKAVEQANKLGVKVISLTGETGGKLKQNTDILVNVPSKDTPRIQETHILIGHILCEIIETELFGK